MQTTLEPQAFRRAIEQAFNAVLITTAELEAPGPQIVYVNSALCEQTGYSPEELLGETPRILQGSATDRAVLDRLREQIGRGDFFEGQTVNYRRDGTPYLVRWNVSPLRDDEGIVTHYISVQTDVTEQLLGKRFNELLLSSLGVGVLGTDTESRLKFANEEAITLLGYEEEASLLGRDMHRTVHGRQADGCPHPLGECPIHQVMMTGEPLKSWRDTFNRRDGSPLAVELFASPMHGASGDVEGLVVAFRDLSAQLALERKLESAAQRDGLTGAFNRRFFDALLEREYARASRQDQPISLLLLDIDHFKSVNDTHGHLIGDEVLKQLVVHIGERLRATDALTRWGGEEFALLLPGTTLEGAQSLAETLRASIASAPLAADLPPVTVSIGVTQLDTSGDDQDAFQRVDDALYAAKKDGRNCVRAAPGDSIPE